MIGVFIFGLLVGGFLVGGTYLLLDVEARLEAEKRERRDSLGGKSPR